MPTFALYNILHSFQDIHKVVLNFAEELTDEQLNWKPDGYSTSIGFHLWHLARESDYLKAAILQHYPGLELGLEDETYKRRKPPPPAPATLPPIAPARRAAS